MSEPWRCKACNQLMYNLDAEGYPAPGAPLAQGILGVIEPICSVCAGMWTASDTNYFRDIDKARSTRAQEVRKRGEP